MGNVAHLPAPDLSPRDGRCPDCRAAVFLAPSSGCPDELLCWVDADNGRWRLRDGVMRYFPGMAGGMRPHRCEA
jgi:hypothetical protein